MNWTVSSAVGVPSSLSDNPEGTQVLHQEQDLLPQRQRRRDSPGAGLVLTQCGLTLQPHHGGMALVQGPHTNTCRGQAGTSVCRGLDYAMWGAGNGVCTGETCPAVGVWET